MTSVSAVVTDRLVNWFLGTWRRYARHVDPVDLRQTIWFACLEAAGRYDPARGSFISYAKHYVRWRVRDLQKAERLRGVRVRSRDAGAGVRWEPEMPDVPGAGPPAAPDDGVAWVVVKRVLTAREYRVLWLRTVEGMTYTAIGRRFRVTKETIRQTELRAITKVRGVLAEKFKDEI